ncbi:MAG TPA: hypothetical protein VNN72_24545 [Polyangiaceae bacterium]|nr:hypothetical protein [Polyangiaceae bacterium]
MKTLRAYRFLVVAFVIAGIALRTRGFFVEPRPLWRDEAGWAFILHRVHLLEPSIRPLGFMALCKLLVHLFGAREVILRLLPWLAGVGSTLLVVPLAERLLVSRAARLFLIGVVALHPAAIDFCKEFKPYSVSLFLHSSCLFLVLRYLDTRSVGRLALALGLPLAGVFFAQDVVFAIPGLYLAILLRPWRDRRLSHLYATAAFAALTLATLLLLYLFFWRQLDVGPSGDATFWAKKYDVFYLPRGHEGRWHWALRKYADIAAFPGERRLHWHLASFLSAKSAGAAAKLFGALWVILHVAGVVGLVRQRRWTALILSATALVVLIAFNQLHFWPFGTFRTNLFVLVYSALLASFGVDTWRHLARLELAPVLCFVVIPLVAFERDWHAQKIWGGHESGFADLSKALDKARPPRSGGPREPLVLDEQVCSVFDYYLSLQPDYRHFARTFERRFSKTCAGNPLDTALHAATRHRVWLALSDSRKIEETLAGLKSLDPRIEYQRVESDAGLVLELEPRRGEDETPTVSWGRRHHPTGARPNRHETRPR